MNPTESHPGIDPQAQELGEGWRNLPRDADDLDRQGPRAGGPRSQAGDMEGGHHRVRGVGVDAVVVLGHAKYYPRFGFQPASRFAVGCEYDVPDEAFMALELKPGSLTGKRGTIRYHLAFAGV